MPKKSKVKKIPAKVGAKATTKSGDKVEVVLNTTRIVKDKTRGKYKPRKKTRKKKEVNAEKDALSVLREKIELEKLQALQQAQRFEVPQRTQNRRTGGDINQFFGKSQRDGTKEAVGDLSKEVKSLREELRKSKEPKEEPKEDSTEPKSKFKEELETTQNEIQRQRISRGIARRDQEEANKRREERIEKLEQDATREQARKDRGAEALFKRRDNLDNVSTSTFQSEDKQKLLYNQRRNPKESGATKSVKAPEPPRAIIRTRRQQRSPEPEPEPISTAVITRDEKLALLRSRRPKSQAINEAVISGGRGGRTPTAPTRIRSVQEILSEQKKLADKKKLESFVDKSKPTLSIDNRPTLKLEEPTDESDFESDGEVFDDVQEDEPITPRTKRRESFLQEIKSPEVEQKIKEQSVKDKLQEEAQKLRELQESGDKAFADRQQAQIQIETDERVARDLILKQARAKDFELATRNVDDLMRKLKDDKQREKKKARDNLRKREQEEFLDKEIGETLSGAIDQSVGERQDEAKKASSKLVGNVFQNVVGGRALANEIITATQNIPRSSGRFSEEKTQEKISDLIHSDYTGAVGRKAYEIEEAQERLKNQRQASDLKEKIVLAFPKIVKQKDYSKEMTAKQLKNQVQEHVDEAKKSGEYSGIKLVQLQTILERLVEKLLAVKTIEQAKRDRTRGRSETKDERELRIRTAQREQNLGGGSD